MSNPKKKVEFFYDVISAYSWFAFEVLCRYQQRWNLNLRLRPFFLGGLIQCSGNKSPAMVPNKLKYMKKDLTALSKYFDVPLQVPKSLNEVLLVKGTLSAQRFLTAVEMKQPHMLESVSRELWLRNWSRDEDVTEPKSLAEAAKKGGMSDKDIAIMLPMVQSVEVKNQLRATTKEVFNLGAFGAPVIVVDMNGKKDWVFGSDRFHILADKIGEEWIGPQPASLQKC